MANFIIQNSCIGTSAILAQGHIANGSHSLAGLVALIPLLTFWLLFPCLPGGSYSHAGGSYSLAGLVALMPLLTLWLLFPGTNAIALGKHNMQKLELNHRRMVAKASKFIQAYLKLCI